MALLQKNLFNSPYAGVYSLSNDKVTLLPPGIPEDDMSEISEALGTKVEIITIGGSSVLGTLAAMNNKGLVVSNLVTSIEAEKLSSISSEFDMSFDVSFDRSNAIGNNFLINDEGGFCNEKLGLKAIKSAEETFAISIVPSSFNNMDTLGMLGCVTNKGGLCHPEVSTEGREKMSETLGVPIMEGTVHFGMPLVGAGIVATSSGAICGRQSTGVELGRIEEALILF